MKSIAEYRKAVVALIGSAVTLLVSALDTFGPHLNAEVTNVLSGVAVVGTAVVTYLVKNGDTIDNLGRT